jgi:hypothetical protein
VPHRVRLGVVVCGKAGRVENDTVYVPPDDDIAAVR